MKGIFDIECTSPQLLRKWIAPPQALLTVALLPVVLLQPSSVLASTRNLFALNIEQLAEVKITSVSRQTENLLDAAASVYVIKGADIRRSGVTSIAEALRLAPGVEVARRGVGSYAVSIRGFSSDIANKLLVLIDGRSVYSPLFAGVFWDVQDSLLEDIDRIEVIAGPGGTLWGANAVNGVINIITRSAADTRGEFVELGAGNQEKGFVGARHGQSIGNGAMRTYAKYFEREDQDSLDNWHMSQAGFRADWTAASSNSFTLQGDIYAGEAAGFFRDDFTLGTLPGADVKDDSEIAGGNLLGRWSRRMDENRNLQLQVYYDRTQRQIPGTYNETRNTFDVDFQYHFRWGEQHDILWGSGYRISRDKLENTLFATFTPAHRSDHTVSAFLQDKIDLWNRQLFLTLGSKFEHNDYTGIETQPNARLSWLIDDRQTVWAAISRAARIPARLNTDLHLTAPVAVEGLPFPIYINVDGVENYKAEKLLAYETGYRVQLTQDLTLDLALFYNDYDHLQTTEPDAVQIVPFPPSIYIVLPNHLDNGMEGHSSGGTLALQWRPLQDWQLQFHYAYFNLQLRLKPGSQDASALTLADNSPEHQLALHSYVDLPGNFSLYTGVRHVDRLPNLEVPRYTALDVSLTWHATPALNVAITGQNLTDDRHPEFSPDAEIRRSVYAKVNWRVD